MSFDSLIFLVLTAKSAIGTIVKSAFGFIGAVVLIGDMGWKTVALGSLLSGAVSVITSIVTGSPEVNG